MRSRSRTCAYVGGRSWMMTAFTTKQNQRKCPSDVDNPRTRKMNGLHHPKASLLTMMDTYSTSLTMNSANAVTRNRFSRLNLARALSTLPGLSPCFGQTRRGSQPKFRHLCKQQTTKSGVRKNLRSQNRRQILPCRTSSA